MRIECRCTLLRRCAKAVQVQTARHWLLTVATQRGYVEIASQLLDAGADVSIASRFSGTARDVASTRGEFRVVELIDAHVHRQLRSHLVDICCATLSLNLPVLVLLECFAWRSSTMYGASFRHARVPLDMQWRIAKLIREQRE